jgi:hypothetical protein
MEYGDSEHHFSFAVIVPRSGPGAELFRQPGVEPFSRICRTRTETMHEKRHRKAKTKNGPAVSNPRIRV